MLIPRVRRLLPSRFLPRGFSFSYSSSPANAEESLSFSFTVKSGRGGSKLEESPVLRRVQLTRPPPTLKGKGLYWNSCSFIGVVASPLAMFKTKDEDKIGYYTWLQVKERPSAISSASFNILLAFWDELAEKASRHLQKDDSIYVWGPLHSFERIDENGKHEVLQKLIVRDLNYVRRNKNSQTFISSQNSNEESVTVSRHGEHSHEMKCGDRLRLWQVFFSNPQDWWDNRHSKRHSWQSDFRHKDTREELTLRPDDPPWVEKQLKLYDSVMSDRNSKRNHSDWYSVI